MEIDQDYLRTGTAIGSRASHELRSLVSNDVTRSVRKLHWCDWRGPYRPLKIF